MREPATFLASAAFTIFTTGCTIIAHELSADLRGLLVAVTGHHWLSVSALAAALFVTSSLLLAGSESIRRTLKAEDIALWSRVLMAVTMFMTLGCLMVYTIHYISG
ncbi:MAG: hypothetical protein A4E45_00435 [Methanosaeta sp. PtaB.Bin039]|nr:MAG: hypothetical protein A4E45_00435 [Methanosaeta sp. PtaB.Bin039]OPY44507.1 MAG: hypothetical protein A4E47_01549 [Methanosaeta sp. PtaU1.Bin028]HOT07080.1 hypothetical protein [Methanotrichaceae archaeon]HQF17085.1 hypothetical protein [Methanotrichaceae archaeon]HQI91706.1 hypothetical protein [Methanotrichaceae archaeon]